MRFCMVTTPPRCLLHLRFNSNIELCYNTNQYIEYLRCFCGIPTAGRPLFVLYQYLETFCRVVDEGSFTKAGESLGFSQPTVTKQIHALEQEMGAVLIRRGQRRLQLTPAGEVVYSHARRILNLVQECRSAIKALEQPGHDELKIGAVFTIALFTLPPVLEEYRQEHPHVTLRVRTGTNQHILSLVLHDEADVGLTTVPLFHPQVSTIRLFDDRVLLVASPKSKWASKRVVTPAEVSQLPM